jgi:hypothetical protein
MQRAYTRTLDIIVGKFKINRTLISNSQEIEEYATLVSKLRRGTIYGHPKTKILDAVSL